MALAAPRQAPHDAPLMIATPDPTARTQRWQLVGFAWVSPDGKRAIWNAYYLVNEETGLVAQAPHNDDGSVRGDTQEVRQVSIATVYDQPSSLWTLDHWGPGFAIRPFGDEHQNLNAWKDDPTDQNRVGIYRWGDGRRNEVWELMMVSG